MYKYYLRNRPPGPGTYPEGAIEVEAYVPGRQVPEIQGTHCFHGHVVYLEPLGLEQVWRYELWPADKVQWALYVFYIRADRDCEVARRLLSSYLNDVDRETLVDFAPRDAKAQAALALLDIGYEYSGDEYEA